MGKHRKAASNSQALPLFIEKLNNILEVISE